MPGSKFYAGFEKEAKLKGSAKLNPQQKRVVEKMDAGATGLLLYHGLGSGKTLSSIAATEGLDTDVVVPAALRENYKKEVKKFSSGRSKRNIISYEGAAKGLKGKDALVLDEVQRINNSATARAKAVMEGSSRYKRRLLLSGTPIRNHPHEIAPIIEVLSPNQKKIPIDEKGFKEKFIAESSIRPGLWNTLQGVKPGVEYSAKNLDLFRGAVKGLVDYHSEDQDGFPERSDRLSLSPMSKEQARIYAYVTSKANPAIARKVKKNLPLSKQESRSLNTFMSGARIASNTTKPYGGTEATPKMLQAVQDVKDGIKKNRKFKALAYSNYLDGGVKEYSKLLKEKGVSNITFTGELSDKEKKKAVEAFNNGDTKALLISGAGAEGIDLKGTRMVQILEPHWNKARVDQAIGRAIRYKSHDHLPKKERRVDVVQYHSVHSQPRFSKLLKRKRPTSADTFLHELSLKKDKLNQAFLNVLKEEGEDLGWQT